MTALLHVTPADAARLAAGETVRVWVAAGEPPQFETLGGNAVTDLAWSVVELDPGVWWWCYEVESEPGQMPADTTTPFNPSVRGDQVEAECGRCDGSGEWWEGTLDDYDYRTPCETCGATGRLHALVTGDPEPSRWCEECRNTGSHKGGPLRVLCPTCHGTPLWGWWLTIKREDEGVTP